MPPVSGGDISANFPPIWASGLAMVVDFVAKSSGQNTCTRGIRRTDLEPLSIRQDRHWSAIPGLLDKFAGPLSASSGMAARTTFGSRRCSRLRR
jgi:hypothetical protein